MAYQVHAFKLGTLVAGADLSAPSNQYRAVRINNAGKVILCAAITDVAIGVLQNTPTLDQPAEICCVGATKYRAGAATTAGLNLSCGTDGRPITAAGVGTPVFGVVLEGTAAANEIGTALIGVTTRQLTA